MEYDILRGLLVLVIGIGGYFLIKIGAGFLEGVFGGAAISRNLIRVVRQYPNEAYEYFQKNDAWLVFETSDIEYIKTKLPDTKVIGPLIFVVPNLGHKAITVYLIKDTLGCSMSEIVNELRTMGKPNNRSHDIVA
jgi:hypothetical protein